MNTNSEDKDVPSYEVDTTSWIHDLVELGREAQRAHKELVVVAIARKMARLMEYHLTQGKNRTDESDKIDEFFTFHDDEIANSEKQSNSIGDKCSKKFQIITEHAIPFRLADIDPLQTRIVIVDDFVASGDTVETVSANIYAQTGIKPSVIAMAADENFDIQKFKFVSNQNKPHFIVQPVQPFMARCSRDILSLKRPIDIEHTILTIGLSQDEVKLMKLKLENALRSVYVNADIYKIEHVIPGIKEIDGTTSITRDTVCNITVLFNKESDNINNDFNKLRFFIGDDELRVVSYAPNIWLGNDLLKDSFDFLSDELNICWANIVNHIKNVKYSESVDKDNNPGDAYRLKTGFEYRNELSKVVLSNYLCSFENILRRQASIKDAIEIALGPNSKQFNVCEMDLNLLVGSSFAKKILPDLKQALRKLEYEPQRAYPKWMIENAQSELMVPDSDRDNYLQERLELLHLSPSFSTTLSLLFERLRKRFGYNKTRQSEDQIKVGETFESILKLMSQEPLYNQDNNALVEIHKWIDSRIDLGVVIPKYERFSIPLGNYVWRRFFRAGEREDVMVDVARLAHCILTLKHGEDEILNIEAERSELLKNIDDLQNKHIGQIPVEVFEEGIHRIRQDKQGDSLAITILWHYMLILGTLSHVDNNKWDEANLNNEWNEPKPNGNYSATSVYK